MSDSPRLDWKSILFSAAAAGAAVSGVLGVIVGIEAANSHLSGMGIAVVVVSLPWTISSSLILAASSIALAKKGFLRADLLSPGRVFSSLLATGSAIIALWLLVLK